MNATTQPALSHPIASESRVDQMYTVANTARTARALGIRPSALLRAFLGPLEDDRG